MIAAFLAVLDSAAIIVVATLILEYLSRRWRRMDAVLWHQAWTAAAAASLVMPLIGYLWPIHAALPAAGASAIVAPDRLTFLRGLLTAAALVYAIGVVVAIAKLAAGLFIVRRLVARSTLPEGLPADRLLESIGPPALRCRVHQRLQVPITVGWLHPVVLLPPTWILWDPSRRDAVVRHELAHTARHDYVWNLIAAIQQTVYWFSPAAWILGRRIRLAAELACDERAATVVGATTYARVLVETARDATHNGTRAGILAVGAITELEARVEALVSPQAASAHSARALRVLVVTAVIIVLALAGSIRLRAEATGATNAHAASHQAAHQAQHQAAHDPSRPHSNRAGAARRLALLQSTAAHTIAL